MSNNCTNRGADGVWRQCDEFDMEPELPEEEGPAMRAITVYHLPEEDDSESVNTRRRLQN